MFSPALDFTSPRQISANQGEQALEKGFIPLQHADVGERFCRGQREICPRFFPAPTFRPAAGVDITEGLFIYFSSPLGTVLPDVSLP